MPLFIKGKIVTGVGMGSGFVGLDWVRRQILEKLGFEPYLGTLNLKMDEGTSSEFHSYIKSRKGTLIEPVDDKFYAGKCFRIKINDKIDGAIVIPLVPNYPEDQIEIITPVNIREILELKDGCEITVELLDCQRIDCLNSLA